MKTVELAEAHLESCVADAQNEQVVLTRGGKAVALLISLDEEQEQRAQSERFWNLIAQRRRQPTNAIDLVWRRTASGSLAMLESPIYRFSREAGKDNRDNLGEPKAKGAMNRCCYPARQSSH